MGASQLKRPINNQPPEPAPRMTNEEYVEGIRHLPGFHYIAAADQLLWVSPELCDLLNHPSSPTRFEELFVHDHERVRVQAEVRYVQPYSDFELYLAKNDGSAVYVRHQARLVENPGNHGAGLIVASVVPLEPEYALREELDVYRKLLNRLNRSGVHTINRPINGEGDGRIIWMNEFESRLLRVDTSRIHNSAKSGSSKDRPLYGSDLLPKSPSTGTSTTGSTSRPPVNESLKAKFDGQRPPTDMRPRVFVEHTPEGEELPVPVRIQDYFVASSPENKEAGRPSRIVTLVLPLALPKKLVEFLMAKGARAPVLEQLGVRSFEKEVHRGAGSSIRFRYLNRLFRKDNRPNDQAWDSLIFERGLTTAADLNWQQLIESPQGLSDRDLYPRKIADRFNADDFDVIALREPLQGFEPHPNLDADGADSEVLFLKIPVHPNGIAGFYWPVQETDAIVEGLLDILETEREDILEELPKLFHIIRKNADKQIVFVSERHASEHHLEPSQFIGKTDREVFKFDPDLAREYERDDDLALSGKEIARHEPHRQSDQMEAREVLTLKGPIYGASGIEGMQCVYWYTDELDKLLRQTRSIDGSAAPVVTPVSDNQVFVSYPRKDRKYLVGSTSVHPPVKGLEASLKVLQKLYKIPYWFDEQRLADDLDGEIQRQLNRSSVIVLLMSPAFFGSEYIRDTELRFIRERKERDPSVTILPILIESCFYQGSEHTHVQWLHSLTPPFNSGSGKWSQPVDAMIRAGVENDFWTAVSAHIHGIVTANPRSSDDEGQTG
jgi:hypothetical protein